MGVPSEPTTDLDATGTAGAEPAESAVETVRGASRWRKWFYVLITALVLIRIVPMILAPLVAARLSRLLGTRVEVGAATLQPIDAIVVLHDVVVHEPRSDASDETEPRLVADRVLIDLQWLPLIHQVLKVREIVFEAGRLDVDRLPDGSFHLASFGPIDPARELPAGWKFALDRIVLLDTQLRVRDLIGPGAGRFEVTLRDAEVSGIGRRPTAFGRALNLRVDALLGKGGRLRVNGRYDARDDGLVLDALVRVKDVPLAQAVSLFSEPTWTALSGRVSGQLRWQREPRRRDILTGRLVLRRATAQVPDLAEPGLAVHRVVAELNEIDFLRRRIGIASLTFHGATLAVRPDAAAPIPLLEGTWPRRTRPIWGGARPAAASRSAPPAWSWMIERFDTKHGQLRVLAPDGAFDLRMHASGENLGPGAYWSPIRLEVSRGEMNAAFDGTVLMSQRLLIEGRLTAGGIDVPTFARVAELPWAELIRSGRGSADLNVQLETERELREAADLRGKIVLANLELVGPDPLGFVVGATNAELTLDSIVPGETTRTGERPTRVEFSDATLTGPYARLVRTEDCGVLPRIVVEPPPAPDPSLADEPVAAGSGGTASLAAAAAAAVKLVAAPAPTAAVKPVAAPAPTPAPAAAGAVPGASPGALPTPTPTIVICGVQANPEADPHAPEIAIRAVQANDGRLTVTDQVLVPSVTWDVTRLTGSARELQIPALTYSGLDIRGSDLRFGELHLSGARRARGSELEFSGTDMALAATTPYLQLVDLPYRFVGGRGSFRSRLSIGEDRWSSDTLLKLREPRFADDPSVIDAAIGMPLARAISLLRDPEGDIVLRVPLTSASLTGRGSVTDVVAAGVRSSIRSAMDFAPVEVAFSPGRARLTEAGVEQLVSVGELLASRSSLVASVRAATTPADQRWLAEQSLTGQLGESDGFAGVLRSFGVSDARARVRDALIARANGGPGPLDAEDEALLERLLLEAGPVSDERLAELGDARAGRVKEYLLEHNYIERDRVTALKSGRREDAGAPTARIEFRLGSDPGFAGVRPRSPEPSIVPSDPSWNE